VADELSLKLSRERVSQIHIARLNQQIATLHEELAQSQAIQEALTERLREYNDDSKASPNGIQGGSVEPATPPADT
jgi:uncharacterized coiled-coil protein SlyX